ncbi:MAG: RluA family pseudouridine synthase [Candidatus Woesebacteria bacterium]
MDFSPLEASIIFEDDSLIAINKPAGWVVNRADTYAGPTVQDWLIERIANSGIPVTQSKAPATEYGTPEEIFTKRGGVVHRLDKDTSGVLLLAKTPDVLVELLREFREREVEKTYVALVHGKLAPNEGTIRLPMDRSRDDRKKFAIVADGRVSETHYQVLQLFPGLPKGISEKKGKSYQGFTLVELKPKTGRTHQIRVHMSALKHPIVGDETYAGKKRIVIDSEWCPRQFLHAKEIIFTHPVTKKKMDITAPLATDLVQALDCMV